MSSYVPEYLRAYKRWTHDDFVRDALRGAFTRAEAARFAKQYLWKLGKLKLEAPVLPGWKTCGTPHFKDGGRIAFLYYRGRRHRFVSQAGRMLGPEQPHLVGAVMWASLNGWHSI